MAKKTLPAKQTKGAKKSAPASSKKIVVVGLRKVGRNKSATEISSENSNPGSMDAFVKNVLIGEIGALHTKSPYLSFILISQGITTLGGLMGERNPRLSFPHAVRKLKALSSYRKVVKNQVDSHGFMIGCFPAHGIALTNGNPKAHLTKETGTGNTILNIENLFADFEKACKEVTSRGKKSPAKKDVLSFAESTRVKKVVLTGKKSRSVN